MTKLAMPMQARILQWWQARSNRERTILLAWGAVVALLLMWFGVVAPLNQRIATLEKRIPELETQLNRMRAQPTGSPSAARPAGTVDGDLRSTLYGWLAERKLSAELRTLSSSRVEMRLPELPAKEALDVLDALRQEYGTRIAVVNLRGNAEPGSAVRIVAELERTP